MTPAGADPSSSDLKGRLLERLHDPVQLRIFVTVAVLAGGYLGVYLPLDGRIEEATRQRDAERKRTELATDLEHLRAELQKFQGRLPKQADSKEWVEYLLSGVRRFPLRLTQLNCDPPRDMGPYRAVVLRIELEGDFMDMDAFLRWLDGNQRLFRTDMVRISPSLGNREVLLMQLAVLGVMG
jgi:Tfp pilus assembly protein PilO